ncbi:YfzA family protein [Lysinibacillus sp. NPDC092081]|uniref:YfzA family protein n=1 Tax=Lysinibacillus sp. NPDC092081 TaxID=3364131 RepID=UPI0037F6BE0F
MRLLKKWIINLGGFLILNLIFSILDGTFVVTNFNFGDFGNRILQTKLFTEWLSFYENPFFNIVAIFAALQIIITALYDISKVISSK